MKFAFVFPGQGSQSIGMGKDLADNYSAAKAIFVKANEALGFDLQKICFEGPVEELKRTAITQPAIFTVSMAAFAVLKEKGLSAEVMAGHSLGEYSALCAAGALDFSDAVRLVNKRGQFMQEAVPEGVGAMAAVLGLDPEKIVAICQTMVDKGLVVAANFNCPGQTVISGHKTAVDAVAIKLKEAGAKRVIPLEVSAPFHSPLMQPAADKLKAELDKIEVKDAVVPVISNVTAQPVQAAADIRRLLISQVTNSVEWEKSIQTIVKMGVTVFVEVGAGKVLKGLVGKCAPESVVYNVEDRNSIENLINLVK